MNPISLVFIMIGVLGFLGLPYALFFESGKTYYAFATRLVSDKQYVTIAYASVFYSFFLMFFLYRVLGLKNRIRRYCRRPSQNLSESHYFALWCLTFLLGVLCLCYVTWQYGGYPPLSVLGKGIEEINVARFTIGQTTSRLVHNLGFKVACVINMIIAFYFFKSKMLRIASVSLFLLTGAFPLMKSEMVIVILAMLLFKMLQNEMKAPSLVSYIFIGTATLAGMIYFTKYASDIGSLVIVLLNRILLGQFFDLPYYFQLFSSRHLHWVTLLPPYFVKLLGFEYELPAATLVSQYLNEDNPLSTFGMASTFFTGEAFAVWGYFGVLISPLIVMLNLSLVLKIFLKMPKNIYTIFLLTFFLSKFLSVFSAFGYFVFSSMHLLLLGLVYWMIMYFSVRLGRGNPNDIGSQGTRESSGGKLSESKSIQDPLPRVHA